MKKKSLSFALALITLAPSLVLAADQQLICTTGRPYETLTAQLEEREQEPGRYRVQSARILDNFGSANLICVGTHLGEISCVGFWFHHPKEIIRVNVTQDGTGKLESRHQLLEGRKPLNPGPWPCHLE